MARSTVLMTLLSPKVKDGRIAFCRWYADGSYTVTIFLSEFICDAVEIAKCPVDAFRLFLVEFWRAYLHELVGHGIGHRFRIKGYSSSKRDHFTSWDLKLTAELIRLWEEDRRAGDIARMFGEVHEFLCNNWEYLRYQLF